MGALNKSIRQIILAAFVFSLTFNMIAYGAEPSEGKALFGPKLSEFDTDTIISISYEYWEYMHQYGRNYQAWPFEVKEKISNRLLELTNRPDTILFSRVPGLDDLSEDEVVSIAWDGLVEAYTLREQVKPWYVDRHVIAFGTMDLLNSYWWVHYSPGASTDHPSAEHQPTERYTVQIDRWGHVVNIVRTGLVGTDPTMDPLMLMLFHVNQILSSYEKPIYLWTDEEKLDMNFPELFPHIGAITTTYGLPRSGDISRDRALSLAIDHVKLIGAIDGATLSDVIMDVSFLVGEPRSYAIRQQTAYPFWQVRFLDAYGDFLCRVCVDPVTGAIVEYTVNEYGSIPIRW